MANNDITTTGTRRIYPSPQPILRPTTADKPERSVNAPKFSEVLQQQLSAQSVKFSKHAEQRLQSRQISLSPEDMVRLNSAIDRAAQKGARDSLILMNQTAFLVNIPNRTVVTAVDGESMKQSVFTNIDSAVIVE